MINVGWILAQKWANKRGGTVKICFVFFFKKELVCRRPDYYARFARQEPVNQNWYNLLENESGRR